MADGEDITLFAKVKVNKVDGSELTNSVNSLTKNAEDAGTSLLRIGDNLSKIVSDFQHSLADTKAFTTLEAKAETTYNTVNQMFSKIFGEHGYNAFMSDFETNHYDDLVKQFGDNATSVLNKVQQQAAELSAEMYSLRFNLINPNDITHPFQVTAESINKTIAAIPEYAQRLREFQSTLNSITGPATEVAEKVTQLNETVERTAHRRVKVNGGASDLQEFGDQLGFAKLGNRTFVHPELYAEVKAAREAEAQALAQQQAEQQRLIEQRQRLLELAREYASAVSLSDAKEETRDLFNVASDKVDEIVQKIKNINWTERLDQFSERWMAMNDKIFRVGAEYVPPLEEPVRENVTPINPSEVTNMDAFAEAATQLREGTIEAETFNSALLTLMTTAGLAASDLRAAGMSFKPRRADAELFVDTLAGLVEEGKLSEEELHELGFTFEEVGNKGKQSADKAKTAHQQFQSTLGSVRYALSAIGINSSSMLGKMVTLVGLLEDAFRGAGSAAQSIIPILGIFLSIGMSVFGTLIKWARKLLNVLVSIGHKLIEISTKAVGIAKKAVTSLTDKIKGFINFFKPSLSKLKKWLMQWGLGARSPYFVIRKIRTMVIDGMKEIAQYSNSVAESMNNFKTALNSVKGSVVSAFEPIASFVIPILTRLLSVLASVLNSIAKFNATLLGRSTYFKFVANEVDEYGKSVENAGAASKKAQKDLMGFDEINRLSAPNEGGSGGSGSDSTGKYVETAINEYSTLSTIAKNIREAWLGITGYDENGEPIYGTFDDSMKMLYDTFWDIGFKIGVNINAGLVKFNSNVKNYKQAAMKIGQSLAAAINGFVDTPALGYNLGAAIANLFNVVFSGLHQFATTVHWDKVGKFIGDGIASALTNFDWYQFFDTIVTFINGLADLIYNVAVGHDWGSIGKNIAKAIFDALQKFDAAKAAQSIHEFLSAMLDFINGFVEQMSTPQLVEVHADVDPKTGKLLSGEVIKEYRSGWDLLEEKIRDFWDNLGAGELGEQAGNAASGGFLGFFKILSGSASITDAVKNFLDGFCKSINNYPWQSAMHNWWDIFYPKLKSFLEWAGPKIVELLQWLWDTIAPKVIEIAEDIGAAIAKGIKEALLVGLGKKIADAFLGTDYEEAIKQAAIENDQAVTQATQQTVNNLTSDDVQKLRENWDTLSNVTQEYLKQNTGYFDDLKTNSQYMTDALQAGGQQVQKSTKQTADTVQQSGQQVQQSTQQTADKVQQSNNQQQQSHQQTCTEAQSAAEKGKAANDKTQKSNQQTADVVQQTNQQQQQSYVTTGSAAVDLSDTSVTSFGKTATAGLQAFASLGTASDDAYATMTDAFDGTTAYFTDLWSTVTKTFSVNGDIAQGFATGIGFIMNTSVNKLIDAVNTYAIDPLIRLSNAVEIIKGFEFGGLKPFASLPKLNFYRIPRLAQGAVLPPNQPFLSMVGDQKSGTNVEAPLETIKQAVAEVMMENNDLLTAGFEAVVRAIQNKDMSVRIGDKDVYEANSNYEKRLNIMRGTV